MHYTLSIPQSCPICTLNPTPTSCSAACHALSYPNLLFLKAWSAKIESLPQNLTTSKSKALLAGKSTNSMAMSGESKVLPHLWWRGFEGVRCSLLLASEIGVRIPLKACDDEGLRASGSGQGVEKRNDINEVVIKTYKERGGKNLKLCICNKGLGDNNMINNHG